MNSINLLPKKIKEEIEQTKINKKTRLYLFKSLVILAFILIIISMLIFYFNQQNAKTELLLSERQKSIDSYGNLEAESRIFAERLNTISRIDREINYWSFIFEEINKIMPNGAYITSLSMDADRKNRSRLTGFALSKNTVATLRNSMDQSDKFEYIDIESSSTVVNQNSSKEEENFIITFSLKKDALKETIDE